MRVQRKWDKVLVCYLLCETLVNVFLPIALDCFNVTRTGPYAALKWFRLARWRIACLLTVFRVGSFENRDVPSNGITRIFVEGYRNLLACLRINSLQELVVHQQVRHDREQQLRSQVHSRTITTTPTESVVTLSHG